MINSIQKRNELFLDRFSVHIGMLYKYLYRITEDAWLVDDLEQDTWFIVLEKMNQLKNPSSAGPWIRKIAYSVAMKHYRKSQNNYSCTMYVDNYVKYMDASKTNSDTLEILILEYEGNLAIKALKRLNGKSQRLIWMRYVMDIKPQQISEIMNLKVSTVKSRLHRALIEYRDSYHELDRMD
ncbi:RNA polymerase sigma factor [Anaerovorax sp. IOR16]|uniref:RNA polymerase sigma factor n=1 Tax=Anaerovorax sp. IOR16 TaxID=2773458 RepID=UPI0019D0694A|nr:sigma-70 family RNA polymerase sigma factor [Anaerovorax sp. IOR16]